MKVCSALQPSLGLLLSDLKPAPPLFLPSTCSTAIPDSKIFTVNFFPVRVCSGRAPPKKSSSWFLYNKWYMVFSVMKACSGLRPLQVSLLFSPAQLQDVQMSPWRRHGRTFCLRWDSAWALACEIYLHSSLFQGGWSPAFPSKPICSSVLGK